jgi:hypothetical protein
MDEELVVYLSYPGMAPLTVRVRAVDTIQSLEARLPDTLPHSFFLDDFELCPAFSLRFCGAYNNCVISAVPRPEEQKKAPAPPAKKSKGAKDVKDQLADQFFSHVEGTTSCYRKLVNKFLHMGAKPGRKRKAKTETVIPQCTQNPATEELPRFW